MWALSGAIFWSESIRGEKEKKIVATTCLSIKILSSESKVPL